MAEPDFNQLCEAGHSHYLAGQYQEALESYDQALKIHPEDAAALRGKAAALLAAGKNDSALECYDRIIAIEPLNAQPLTEKADVLAGLKRFEEALAHYDRGLALGPTAEICLKKGAALRKLGRQQEALQCYERALELNPGDAQALSGKGDVLLDLEQYSEAFECYEQAGKNSDGAAFRAADWGRRGDTLYSLGKTAQALFCYEKAIAGDPKNFWALRGKAIALSAQHKFDEALPFFDQALDNAPQASRALALVDKGNALLEQLRYPEALALYDQALEIEPQNFFALANKGVVLQNLGRYDEANLFYDKAIEIDGSNSILWQSKGWCLDQLGNTQEALNCLEHALGLDPASIWAWNNKGWLLAKLGRNEEAMKAFDQAIAIDKTEALPWVNMASSLAKLGHVDKAEECLKTALGVARNRAHVLNGLGWLFTVYKYDHQKALEFFRQALELNPNDISVKINIAECLVKTGVYGEGRDFALQVERDSADVVLQCVARYLVMASFALEGDAVNREKHFERFIEYYVSSGIAQKGVGIWSYRGFVDAVTKTDVPLETKFVLLTLIDLLDQKDLVPRLTFFAEQAKPRAGRQAIPSASA